MLDSPRPHTDFMFLFPLLAEKNAREMEHPSLPSLVHPSATVSRVLWPHFHYATFSGPGSAGAVADSTGAVPSVAEGDGGTGIISGAGRAMSGNTVTALESGAGFFAINCRTAVTISILSDFDTS